MPKSVIVVLGEKEYTIQSLPMRQTAEWRRKLSGPFGEITATLRSAGTIEISSGHELADLLHVVSETLLGSMDILIDLLFQYAGELRDDRERIETEAFDDEAMQAFVEVLKLAYPFGQILSLINGARKRQTS